MDFITKTSTFYSFELVIRNKTITHLNVNELDCC